MDTRDHIRRQIVASRRTFDGVTETLTDDLINWLPPGTANPISSTLTHVFGSEDVFIQRFIQGKTRLWDTEGWSQKVGVADPPGRGTAWEEYRSKRLSLVAILAYRDAVRVVTDAYLERLTDADLERQVDFAGGKRSVADMLGTLVSHTAMHSGEIAALKGIQGVQGLPG